MATEFEQPTAEALLVIETEPYHLGPRIPYRPLRLLSALIGLFRQFVSKLRP
jgi:hypothetical protein